jgi:hypothetical protein
MITLIERIQTFVPPPFENAATEIMSAVHWLKATLLLGLVAALAILAWMVHSGGDLAGWMFWLIWPAMAVHQVEENVFTELILGQRGRFTSWVRTVGYDITPRRALTLNVGVGWTLAIAAGLAGEHLPLVPLFVAIVEAVNGLWHLSITSLTRRWSPGVLSGVVIAVPLAFFLIFQCLRNGTVSPLAVLILIVLACVSHHLFLSSLPRMKT